MINELKTCWRESFTSPVYLRTTGESVDTCSKRIEFLDLAKGICILLVVLFHFCEKWFNVPNLAALRMPLYFTLSGLFFKTYGNIRSFLIKKTNNILIPYIFWFIAGIVGSICSNSESLRNVETYQELQDMNMPIWFLLCLFNANVLFYMLQYFFRNYALFIAVCIVSMIGIFCETHDVSRFLELGGVCWFFPFFYMGYMLKNTLITIQAQRNIVSFLLGITAITFSYAIFYVTTHSGIDILTEYNSVINRILSIINSMFYVIGFLLLCKIVVWLPIISYIGRYSIIVLCTHVLIMKLLYVVFGRLVDDWLLKFVFMASLLFCCWIAIPICKKWLPYFVAQKPLLK